MSYFRPNVESTAGYQPGYQPKQPDVIKLNTNENPYPPSPAVMKALASIDPEWLRRYPDPICTGFRQAASQVHGIPPEYIICGNGADELLAMAVRAFCDRDRPLAYPVPTYSLYCVLGRLEDCPVIEIPFDEEFNLPSQLASTGAALTIVCNPNAPSGTLVSKAELASLADELSGVLLIDEAYVDFAPCDSLDLVERFENVIVLRSLSKGYSLAGLRFGYAMARPSIIEGLLKVKDSYNVDAIAAELATAAITDQQYHRQVIESVKTARQGLITGLRKLGLEVMDSHANFVLVRITKRPAKEVYEGLVGLGIYVRYFEMPGLTDKLRISVGTNQQNGRLLEAIGQLLKV